MSYWNSALTWVAASIRKDGCISQRDPDIYQGVQHSSAVQHDLCAFDSRGQFLFRSKFCWYWISQETNIALCQPCMVDSCPQQGSACAIRRLRLSNNVFSVRLIAHIISEKVVILDFRTNTITFWRSTRKESGMLAVLRIIFLVHDSLLWNQAPFEHGVIRPLGSHKKSSMARHSSRWYRSSERSYTAAVVAFFAVVLAGCLASRVGACLDDSVCGSVTCNLM